MTDTTPIKKLHVLARTNRDIIRELPPTRKHDMSITRAPVAQFEISIDGTPRSSRDLKPLAIEAAEYLKRKHPNSAVMVKDLQSGETMPIEYKPDLGPVQPSAASRKSAHKPPVR